jgi:NAD(P)-dependent dehydrogenase (short-subunit alcohol dehydrogenase family)
LDAAARRRVKLQFKVSGHNDRAGFSCFLNLCQAIQATGFKNAELALVDLSRFASVSAFADTFIRDEAQIDILVYNAGVALHHYAATGDGCEET